MKNWDDEIGDLCAFFDSIDIPTGELRIAPWAIIVDQVKFIESHLSTVKANNGKMYFKPYLIRLKKLKKYYETRN